MRSYFGQQCYSYESRQHYGAHLAASLVKCSTGKLDAGAGAGTDAGTRVIINVQTLDLVQYIYIVNNYITINI